MADHKQRPHSAPSWLRFSLSQFMFLVLVIAVLVVVFIVRPQRQRVVVDNIRRLGGNVTHFSSEDASAPIWMGEPTWFRTLLGEQSVRVGEVRLSGRLVTDTDLDGLGFLRDMRVLYLDGTQITDAALAHLAGMTRLEELSLQGTHITNEGLAALGDLPSLHTLNLDNTGVTAEALVLLRRMPKLERVTMLGLDLNRQDLYDTNAVNRKLRFLNRSDVVSDPRLLNEIVQAWDARQNSVRSLAVKCVGRGTEGGISFATTLEVSIGAQRRIRLSQKNVLGKDTSPMVDPETIVVFDEKRKAGFSAKPAGPYYPAVMTSYRYMQWCSDLRLLPLAIAYRPLRRPDSGVIAKESLAVSQNVATIDGEECIGLYHAEGMVWVSPSRDYLPMRYSEIRRGVTCLDVQLSYAKDGEHGWVPSSWKTSSFQLGPTSNYRYETPSSWKPSSFQQDRTFTYRYEVRVDEYRVNEPMADSVFEITYPPGTLICDETNAQTYLLRDDGTRVPVNPGEYADIIQKILDSIPDGHSPEASDEPQ